MRGVRFQKRRAHLDASSSFDEASRTLAACCTRYTSSTGSTQKNRRIVPPHAAPTKAARFEFYLSEIQLLSMTYLSCPSTSWLTYSACIEHYRRRAAASLWHNEEVNTAVVQRRASKVTRHAVGIKLAVPPTQTFRHKVHEDNIIY